MSLTLHSLKISAKENGQSRDDLETDLITMRAEIDALKRSTPEGKSS